MASGQSFDSLLITQVCLKFPLNLRQECVSGSERGDKGRAREPQPRSKGRWPSKPSTHISPAHVRLTTPPHPHPHRSLHTQQCCLLCRGVSAFQSWSRDACDHVHARTSTRSARDGPELYAGCPVIHPDGEAADWGIRTKKNPAGFIQYSET